MAVLKTSFRFPEINLGFVTSARGAGHLTPQKSLGRGALTKERARMVGNLTKKIKNVKCPGFSRGGMDTLGFDSYIMHSTSLLCPPPYVTKVCFATCIIINTCPFFTNILFENVEKL